MTARLIITADDYGMCESVNKAIEGCMAAGGVTATCVMTNMPYFTMAASLRRNFPQASVGLHWTLTQGRPVLSATKVQSLVQPDGTFHTFKEFRRRWLFRQINVNELINELEAQYEQAKDIIGEPDFWNTHENVHVWPGIFGQVVKVAHKLGIEAMRCHRRQVVLHSNIRMHMICHPMFWLKGAVIDLLSKRAERLGFTMPSGLLYIPDQGSSGKEVIYNYINEMKANFASKTVEIAMHPATTVDTELFGILTESRVREYKTFSNRQFISDLASAGILLVNFKSLGKGNPSGRNL